MNLAARLAVSLATSLLALAGLETALRVVDGVSLTEAALPPGPRVAVAIQQRALAQGYVGTLPVAPGVDRSWYAEDPVLPPAPPPDASLASRLDAYRTVGLPVLYEWNREYLRRSACDDSAAFAKTFGPYEQVFVFTPHGGVPYPTFRFLREATYPSGLVTNEFGWRGPGVAIDKPARTIRIVFVGASTTAGFHSAPFSYPEYVGVWLNRWSDARGLRVRFEVLSAGREGINSSSIAAVVRQEVAPLEPDLVIYYEGSNQFWPSSYVDWPDGRVPDRPRIEPRAPWGVERFSVTAVRTHHALDSLLRTGDEPPKPALAVHWPASLDELNPALNHPDLPLNLGTILGDLEGMRMTAVDAGGELVIASFLWLFWDGMQLDRSKYGGIYHYINEAFWPFSYAHLRRFADFQNRVFAAYSRQTGAGFIDFAAAFPKDPAFFADAIHFRPEGMKLQAWVVLQQIIPLLEDRIGRAALPRPDRAPLPVHPAFAESPRHLVAVNQFGADCAGSEVR